jgi:hypothetical protein
MPNPTYCFNITGAPDPREFNRMPFGRQLEHWKTIRAFQQRARKIHLDCKGITVRKAMQEFIIHARCIEW